MPFKQRSDDDETVSSVDVCEEYLVKTAGDIFSEKRLDVQFCISLRRLLDSQVQIWHGQCVYEAGVQERCLSEEYYLGVTDILFLKLFCCVLSNGVCVATVKQSKCRNLEVK